MVLMQNLSKKSLALCFLFCEVINIDFANTKILGEEKCSRRRLIMEGLEIKKLPTTERANMQSGYEIDPCWEDILKIQGT